MSMHIKMKDEYTQTTTYHGKLDDKYSFIVEVSYGSSWDAVKNNYISSVEFIGCSEAKGERYWKKAENKIKDFVTKWLFKKPKNKS